MSLTCITESDGTPVIGSSHHNDKQTLLKSLCYFFLRKVPKATIATEASHDGARFINSCEPTGVRVVLHSICTPSINHSTVHSPSESVSNKLTNARNHLGVVVARFIKERSSLLHQNFLISLLACTFLTVNAIYLTIFSHGGSCSTM